MNSEVKNVLFIVNKYAGGRIDRDIETRIARAAGQCGLQVTIRVTERPGHATDLAAEACHARQHQLIVAAGGDGTINETARALVHTGMPWTIIPLGSGNGLARHLRIPLRIEDAIRQWQNSQVIDIDAFTINGKLSLNVSGIGFDGHVAYHFGKGNKRGLAGYLKNVLREYRSFRPFEATLTTDAGARSVKPFVVAIANSSQYGNNARIAPDASVRDGLLHVSILEKIPLFRLDVARALFAGSVHKTPFCETFATTHLSITLPTPIAWHVDGEPEAPLTQFEIKVVPRCLKLLIPLSDKYTL